MARKSTEITAGKPRFWSQSKQTYFNPEDFTEEELAKAYEDVFAGEGYLRFVNALLAPKGYRAEFADAK